MIDFYLINTYINGSAFKCNFMIINGAVFKSNSKYLSFILKNIQNSEISKT